ncbi:AraC family transcriptional regulator [Nitzschia inconspicua]|uniref:methylated-DNA--[protein]-cysteine S-methyltransferase n=1 Tax=Nitzschia inconspicua TaxID=303405 RepID=A0A9K3P9C4_9STRA|nr:AraC family transcriptional regulator [Nitzschia inconspicua]
MFGPPKTGATRSSDDQIENLALTAVQKETLSSFQIEVYKACMQIPNGKVATYKWIADAILCRSSQAVGQALKRNPYNGASPSFPCHRGKCPSGSAALSGFEFQFAGILTQYDEPKLLSDKNPI